MLFQAAVFAPVATNDCPALGVPEIAIAPPVLNTTFESAPGSMKLTFLFAV
jgi:hypothetical protein